MEFKGTKGKWSITTDNEIGILISGFNPLSDITTVHRYGFQEEEDANALLISKAPEMLEFIDVIANTENIYQHLREKAQQLIKEATEL